MRIITNSSWRAHTAPIFNKLKVLTLFDINKNLCGRDGRTICGPLCHCNSLGGATWR